MKFSNKKKIILGSVIGVLIGTLMSVSYAFFTYANTSGTNSTLVTGDIYMRYKESSTTININDMMPMSGDPLPNQYFEFTVEGKNTNTTKDIWYEIDITHGALPTINDKTKNENQRINDKFLKFTLKEKKDDGSWTTPINAKSYSDFSNGFRIWVDTIEKNQTTDTTHTYQLYVWVDESVTISNTKTTGVDYTMSEWNDLFASIQVNVTGDFTVKELPPTVNVMNTFPNIITNQKANIKEVYFRKMDETTMNTRFNAASINADLTYNNEGKVLAWLETNSTDNTKYNLIVASDGETYLTTGSTLFAFWTNLSKIVFSNINTSRIHSMMSMFYNANNLLRIDLSNFNTENVTTMEGLFKNCTALQEINFGNDFETYNVSNMSGMFQGCQNLSSVDLSNFDISNTSGSSVSWMFDGCSQLTRIYVSSKWDSSSLPSGMPIFGSNTSLVGQAPNKTYSFTDYNTADKTYAVIATDTTPGYFTDISLKPAN